MIFKRAMFTEDDAKHRQCPERERMCSGSACMAWRWFETEPESESGHTGDVYGFCGLAGCPDVGKIPSVPASVPA